MQIKMFHFCPSPSDGTGRAGTYILIDMVLNRMAKGKSLTHTHTHTRKHKQMITQITLYIVSLLYPSEGDCSQSGWTTE